MFSAVVAIFIATAGNALFLQERSRRSSDKDLPRTDILVLEKPQPDVQVAPVSGADQQVSPAVSAEVKFQAALQRELGKRGYSDQLQAGPNGLRLAVLAYEFDNGMTLTGEPTKELLKRIIFDLNQAPRGAFADRAEINSALVMQIQKTLLELGFFSGTLSGRVDVWTVNAIKAFERYRHIPITGRLAEGTLLDLITYSGQTISASSG
jgi:hypothetical protein